MGKFNPFIAALYTQLNATLVPVAVNTGLFWPRHTFTKISGNIIIEFLKPIEPGLDRKRFMNQLQEQIRIATQKLEKEAGFNPK